MNQEATLLVRIHLRWWVTPYLHGVALFAATFGFEPDLERIGEFVVRHGVNIECCA